MGTGASSKPNRREVWVMGLIFAGLLVLPLLAWGAVKLYQWNPPHGWPLHRCAGGLETNAVGACRAYCEAQSIYRREDWGRNGKLEYADSLTRLRNAEIIDTAFAAATSPDKAKHGYYFGDMSTIGGKLIDREKDFAFCATPAVYGNVGWRTFIVCTDGLVFGKDLGGSELVDDYPADPCADGWIVAE
jgi:hypothetical protein